MLSLWSLIIRSLLKAVASLSPLNSSEELSLSSPSRAMKACTHGWLAAPLERQEKNNSVTVLQALSAASLHRMHWDYTEKWICIFMSLHGPSNKLNCHTVFSGLRSHFSETFHSYMICPQRYTENRKICILLSRSFKMILFHFIYVFQSKVISIYSFCYFNKWIQEKQDQWESYWIKLLK